MTRVAALPGNEAAIEAAIEAATEAGAQGMIYVGAAEKDMRYVLTTPLPFRNSAGVGERHARSVDRQDPPPPGGVEEEQR